MKAIFRVGCVVLLSACTREPAVRPPVDSEAFAVRRAIDQGGARKVVDSAFYHQAFGELLESRIGSGDSAWLDIARQLRAVSDAGMSEDLDMSLAAAIPAAPEQVLRLLGDSLARFSFEWVCRGEIIMDDVDTIRADTINRAYRGSAIAALARVRSADILTRRDSCTKMMKEAR